VELFWLSHHRQRYWRWQYAVMRQRACYYFSIEAADMVSPHYTVTVTLQFVPGSCGLPVLCELLRSIVVTQLNSSCTAILLNCIYCICHWRYFLCCKLCSCGYIRYPLWMSWIFFLLMSILSAALCPLKNPGI
jgi:hypothetical protein